MFDLWMLPHTNELFENFVYVQDFSRSVVSRKWFAHLELTSDSIPHPSHSRLTPWHTWPAWPGVITDLWSLYILARPRPGRLLQSSYLTPCEISHESIWMFTAGPVGVWRGWDSGSGKQVIIHRSVMSLEGGEVFVICTALSFLLSC